MTTADHTLERVTKKDKKISIIAAGALIATCTSFAIYSLTPSSTSYADNKLNSLFAQCSASVLVHKYNKSSCEALFEQFGAMSKRSKATYISDEVMFKLHESIEASGQKLDISQATNGFLQHLPSGKYVSTRRASLFRSLIDA